MTRTQPENVSTTVSTEEIRSQFPALARGHAGHPVAYFDGPGGTQVPRCVVEAMTGYFYHHNANTNWVYPTSAETDDIIERGRVALADFFNASPREIVFGPNMTTLTYHLTRALGREWGPSDEVIITEMDHHGNIGPWEAIERERGVTLRTVKLIPGTGQLDWEQFADLLNSKTRLVAMGAASNALGTINDVARATQMAHQAGALMFVDAVHYVPHVLADVRAIGCDFLACSAYKFYGPHIGMLYGKEDLLQSIDFPKVLPAPDAAPERAETGTQNHEGIAGTTAAVDFLASLAGELGTRRERLIAAFNGLHERASEMVGRLWEGLSAINGVTMYGPPPDRPRTPTVVFTVEGVASTEVARGLATRFGVFVSHGDFYATTVVERLGLGPEGLVRAGCACYTTDEEIDRLITGIERIGNEQV